MDKGLPADQPKKSASPAGEGSSPSPLFADLHLHTSFSDGTYSPEELVEHGRRNGLSAMALTDHDTVEGCPRMAAACERAGIEFVPGTELTAEIDGYEVHLLGYFVAAGSKRRQTRSIPRNLLASTAQAAAAADFVSAELGAWSEFQNIWNDATGARSEAASRTGSRSLSNST